MIRRAFILPSVLFAVAGPVAGWAQTYEAAAASRALAFERLISSVKIETRQEAVTSDQVSLAENASLKALATSTGEVDRALAVREAMQRYESMQTGVAGACSDVEGNKLTERATGNAQSVMSALTEQERKWIEDGGSRVDILSGTQSARESFLCSGSEMAAGLCSQEAASGFGGIAAGDSDASTFLLRGNGGARSYGDVEAMVGLIYMDTLLPLPNLASRDEASESGVAGGLLRATGMREMALISLGRLSMGGIIARGLEGGTE